MKSFVETYLNPDSINNAVWVGIIGFGFVFCPPARAQERSFYRNKTINLSVGAPPGGSLDLHARLLSRYLGRYIPGNPAIVLS